jgi:hypothetical protein
MLIRQRRYSKEEIARRGDEIYQRAIKAKVESSHKGEFVVIDIKTGSWEMVGCIQVSHGYCQSIRGKL